MPIRGAPLRGQDKEGRPRGREGAQGGSLCDSTRATWMSYRAQRYPDYQRPRDAGSPLPRSPLPERLCAAVAEQRRCGRFPVGRLSPADRVAGFPTRLVTEGANPSLHIEFKRCHIKQYFKEGRALRTETTLNASCDFGVGNRLWNSSYFRPLGDHILEVDPVAQDCSLAPAQLANLMQPPQT